MSLRKKTLLLIGLTLIGLIALLYTTSRAILLDSFMNLEEQGVSQLLHGTTSMLDNELADLRAVAWNWASRADNVDLVRLLLGRGGKASAANRYGVTPLSLAAVNGSAAITRLLLDAGANPNASSGEGETVLMTAARTGRPEPVALLLARGANLAASEKS